MEPNTSKILKVAIELDELLIEKYLIEQQKKSTDSPQIFYGKLKSKIKEINEENPRAMKWLFHEDLGGWFEEMGLINRNIEKEGILTASGPGRFLEHLEELYGKFVLLSEKINQLFDSHTFESTHTTIYEPLQPIQGQKLVNKFNAMPIEEVSIIFSPLINTKNKANQYWMTRKDFDIFLKRSFGKEDLAKPKINFSATEKGCIIKLFHFFYTKSKAKREITSILIKPYKELLAEAFETEVFFNLHNQNFSSRARCDWMIELK
jgi:hypothetical protein